jgi:DNA-binding beta-propeller fold protein YncE
MSTFCQAASIMSLVPNTTAVTVTPTTAGVVTYTVTNTTAELTLTGISIEPNYGGGNAGSMSLSADTCSGSALVPSASCTFTLNITGTNQPDNFTLSPRVCSSDKLACSQAISSNRPAVSIQKTASNQKAYIALNDGTPADSAVQPILIANQSFQPLITGLDFLGAFPPLVGLTLSNDGKNLYVSNAGGHTLDIFDITGTPSLLTSIPVGPAPEGMAVTNDKNTVYLADLFTGTIYVIDVPTQQIHANTLPLHGAPYVVSLSPDQTKYYTTDIDHGIVYGFYTSNDSQVGNYSGLANPLYVLVSPNNSTLYVNDSGTGKVLVLDANALTLQTSFTPPSGGAESLALSPDGSLLYVGTYNGIDIFETTGYTRINSVLGGQSFTSLSLDSTGQTLYGMSWGSTTVYSLDTRSLVSTPITVPGPAYNLSTKFIQ